MYSLDPELQRYFSELQPQQQQQQQQQEQQEQQNHPTTNVPDIFGHHQQQHDSMDSLRARVELAISSDPVLAYVLRLDSVLEQRHKGSMITCTATVRRNIHQLELAYLQRFKQIAEPAVRHPKHRELGLLCLDTKALRCGQRVLVKLHSRNQPTEPMRLLREYSILHAHSGSSGRASGSFPKAYLFGCLGDQRWRVQASADASDSVGRGGVKDDQRQITVYKGHFLVCQYVPDSLQHKIDANRAAGECVKREAAVRLCKDMLNRLLHLHSLGWTHGGLRPESFQFPNRVDQHLVLLADFDTAAPIGRSCLTFNKEEQQEEGEAKMLADYVSLVYIACSMMTSSKRQLPWERRQDACAPEKATFWQFVGLTMTMPSTDDETDNRAADADKLWQENPWLGEAFNCANREQVGQQLPFRLAATVAQMLGASSDAAAATTTATTATGSSNSSVFSPARAAIYYCGLLANCLH